jgi:DNA-binding transcriptional MocR family regulator
MKGLSDPATLVARKEAWAEAYRHIPHGQDAAVQALAGRSVKIHTLGRYRLRQSPRSGLVFGYGAVDVPEIERGLAELQGVLTQ